MGNWRDAGWLGLCLLSPLARADVDVDFSGRFALGAVYRMQARAPQLLQTVNAAALGLPGSAGSGQNMDDGQLNFGPHDALSGALHGYLDAGLRGRGWHALVRVLAWYDDTLRHAARPWGNSPNGYQPGLPLSDVGFAPLSRFSGLLLGDAWVAVPLGGGELRLGQQSLGWGEGAAFPGGLAVLDAADLPALHRAGSSAPQWRVPAPQLVLHLPLAAGRLEAFVQTRFRANAADGCGTFFAINDFSAEGCNRVVVGQPNGPDAQRLGAGAYLKRIASPYRPGAGEFGLAWRQRLEGEGEWGLYGAQFTARHAHPGLKKSTRAGLPFISADPDGRNVSYFVEYPDAVRMLALRWQQPIDGVRWSAELAWRPNQPLQQTATDLLTPFVNASAAALLRREVDALPPGGLYHGYDRKPVSQLQAGAQWQWQGVGLRWGTAFDAVWKHVHHLPPAALRRYGRADVFNPGPVNGSCSVSSALPALQCSLDGFVSADALGMRVRVDTRVSGLAAGLVLQPSVTYARDLHGWSYDNQLNAGRQSAQLALRAQWHGRYTGELVLAPIWGGHYNALVDRDWLAWSLGVKF
ncbi:DUF1302 domain-containing protein [Massilia sp. TS11]|uniref:DUF1302 domain-containing protein n=1 Tax=Massilia sp. TS11 TaxID=2908003 RepID=UPI001EDB0FF1|nr:DUF1302 family protein [Massilia sp. TS11]MCG2584478.1 DUF1302 domain-containing protein [Massilia sp. TS11]